MTYLSDRTRRRKNYKYYVVFVVLFSALVYFWPNVRVFLYRHIEPVITSYGSSKTFFSDVPKAISTYFTSRNEFAENKVVLELNIENLENRVRELEGIIEEYELRGEIIDSTPKSTMILYPVMQDITKIYSTIILSKGFRNGVEEGSLVYIRGKQPVCTITEVYDKTSLCRLLSSSGEKIEGVTSSAHTLFLEGLGGGAFVADVPYDAAITLGQTVALKSEQSMILGKIVEIVEDEQTTTLHVYVRGEYNPVTSNVFYISK
jgi:cell shape-determining protein MreC